MVSTCRGTLVGCPASSLKHPFPLLRLTSALCPHARESAGRPVAAHCAGRSLLLGVGWPTRSGLGMFRFLGFWVAQAGGTQEGTSGSLGVCLNRGVGLIS